MRGSVPNQQMSAPVQNRPRWFCQPAHNLKPVQYGAGGTQARSFGALPQRGHRIGHGLDLSGAGCIVIDQIVQCACNGGGGREVSSECVWTPGAESRRSRRASLPRPYAAAMPGSMPE